MPISELVFSGITRAVSDINTTDGSTAELINAVVENNEIRPAPLSLDPAYNFGIPGKLLGIHSLDNGEEVIISEALEEEGWYLHFDLVLVQAYAEIEKICSISLPPNARGGGQVNTLGNVVIYGSPEGTYYFLYKEGSYLSLGEKPPFPKLVFGMGNVTTYVSENSTIPMTLYDDKYISAEDHQLINTTAQALINKFLSKCRKESRFVFPFFVRYALRMSDGTHILHSAPILMNPSTDDVPFAVYQDFVSADNVSSNKSGVLTMQMQGFSSNLIYRGISKANEVGMLANWTDIITHIDIFISAPIYSYKEITPDYNSNGNSQIEYESLRKSYEGYGVVALRHGLFRGLQFITKPAGVFELKLPAYSIEEQYEAVKDTSLFYLVHSLPISEFIGAPDFEWVDVPIKDTTLDTLVNRPVLTDDFNSHVSKTGNTSEVYNQRLTLADMSFKAYEGYPLATMKPAINTTDGLSTGRVMTVLQKGATRIVVDTGTQNFTDFLWVNTAARPYGYYYYPDPDAKEMYVSAKDLSGNEVPRRLQLIPHAALNGAFCFLGYPTVGLSSYNGNADWPTITSINTYQKVSEVYQSQVGNPFHFPLDGITSIGNTRLIALIASSIEVSTGQVGDFPMYAFTEEGVWVLGINQEGWISSPQLISNDVCLGRSAIVALNRPIIYATDRGLMLLEGSKITSLSDKLLGPRMDVSRLIEDLTSHPEYHSDLQLSVSEESFIDFLSGKFSGGGQTPAYFVYDYSNSRVLIMHSAKRYAYVLTLSNFEFSKMVIPMEYIHAVPHYTGVYFQAAYPNTSDADRRAIKKLNTDIDVDGDTTHTNVIVVTRPIKFGEMNLKGIRRLLTRHNCAKGVKAILYGSRDGLNYSGITSLRGFSYRYFILALFATMTQQERISTVSIDWDRKFTNKLR